MNALKETLQLHFKNGRSVYNRFITLAIIQMIYKIMIIFIASKGNSYWVYCYTYPVYYTTSYYCRLNDSFDIILILNLPSIIYLINLTLNLFKERTNQTHDRTSSIVVLILMLVLIFWNVMSQLEYHYYGRASAKEYASEKIIRGYMIEIDYLIIGILIIILILFYLFGKVIDSINNSDD
ncbi:MAG: hypothetical protein OEZ01_15885 [Candidatus Heimdallarchaeota archaeon]|nr:hypothetical protein [Candidatus Heimdallarchaeota archaeon]MDH5647491.1 hypothetical protein [Candidatus Heimdallarchaeota archaeon]